MNEQERLREQLAAMIHASVSDATGKRYDEHAEEKWCRRAADRFLEYLKVAGLDLVRKP